MGMLRMSPGHAANCPLDLNDDGTLSSWYLYVPHQRNWCRVTEMMKRYPRPAWYCCMASQLMPHILLQMLFLDRGRVRGKNEAMWITQIGCQVVLEAGGVQPKSLHCDCRVRLRLRARLLPMCFLDVGRASSDSIRLATCPIVLDAPSSLDKETGSQLATPSVELPALSEGVVTDK